MKKTIKGKVYDTSTAKLIGYYEQYENSVNYWCCERLYRKQTREFFLHGQGGNGSKYAATNSRNEWTGGEKIIPLTYEAAREWAEDHLSADAYNAIFGAVAKDDTRTLVTLSMSVSAIEKAKRAAAQTGMSLSAYIESLVIK